MTEIKKILVPCDLTDNSMKVLPHAVSLSEKYNSKIYLLYVDDVHVWAGHYVPHPSLQVFKKEALEEAEKAVDKICEEQLPHCPSLEKRIVSGDPATEILKTIEAEDIDCVVMGTHGRKGMEHTIFGSVAENVVKKSRVPVLVVNPYWN